MRTGRQEVIPRLENLFFEMSRPVESPEMPRSWVERFQGFRIPCAIARTEEGYTPWRKGKEVGRKKSKALPMRRNFVYSSGLTPKELNLLKEIEHEKDNESLPQPSEGFEDMPPSPYEESQEGLTLGASARSCRGRGANAVEKRLTTK